MSVPYPDYPPASAPMWLSSHWLAANVLMLDPKRVVVSDTQEEYHKMFESLGIECIKVWNGHALFVSLSNQTFSFCWVCRGLER